MAAIKLRCKGRQHGTAVDAAGTIEVLCTHIACTGQRKAVALHTIDLSTGLIKDTKVFSQDFWRNRR